jgi:hypothetical protein
LQWLGRNKRLPGEAEELRAVLRRILPPTLYQRYFNR